MTDTIFEMNDKGDVLFLHADMREALKALPENSVDSVVTDPPYGLEFMGKAWDSFGGARNEGIRGGTGTKGILPGYGRGGTSQNRYEFRRKSATNFQEFCEEWAGDVFRVLKPGGHLAAFGGTRTYHRMACAIEDAGFEIRDTLMYLYGVGFPKSHSISRALEKEWECELENSNAYSAAEFSSQNGGVGAKVGRDSVPVLVWDLVSEGDRLEYARIADASSTWPQHTLTAQTEVVLARFVVWGAKQNGNAGLSATLTLIGKAVGLPDQMVISLSEQAMAGIDLSTISSWNHLLDGALSQTKMSTIVMELSQITGLKIWNCLPYLSMLASTLPLGTALKPAVEPIILARKPLSEKTVVANVLRWRTGAINIDGCRVESDVVGQEPWEREQFLCDSCAVHVGGIMKPSILETKEFIATSNAAPTLSGKDGSTPRGTSRLGTGCCGGMKAGDTPISLSTEMFGNEQSVLSQKGMKSITSTATKETIDLKICSLCGKPITSVSISENILASKKTSPQDEKPHAHIENGSGKIQNGLSGSAFVAWKNTTVPKGRWPANLVIDGSDEVVALFPNTAPSRSGKPRSGKSGDGWGMTATGAEYDDFGSAARFFYAAKASRADRAGSRHPTVKPISLMRWLTRLITPPGGLVLDPFAGSGTTGAAALEEGMRCLLIEREAEYADDIRRRLSISDIGLI